MCYFNDWICIYGNFKQFYPLIIASITICQAIRVHKIAYGFGSPSESISVLINFLLQNTNLVSVSPKFCWSCLTELTNFANSGLSFIELLN